MGHSMAAVSLQAVVDEFDTSSASRVAYLHRDTGELFTVGDDERCGLEMADDDSDDLPDWEREERKKLREIEESDRWLALPTVLDFNEWSLMKKFCLSLPAGELRDELQGAIHQRGAFRRFKDLLHRHGTIDEWYRYRGQRLSDFLADWLRAKGIEFA